MAQELSMFYFKKAINKFGAEYVKELTRQLILADKKATGELIRSLDYKLIEASNEILVKILAKSYLIYVNDGRKPGSMPPVKNIIKWAEARNITPTKPKYKTIEQVGWAIAKSIEKKGIKPTNVIEKATSNLLKNKKVIDEVATGGLLDINNLINKTFLEVTSSYGKPIVI